jgi:hypothetical protein
MLSNTDFHIEERKTGGREREWTYTEGARRLVIEVEMSGVPHLSWVILDSAFSTWTEPNGVALSAADVRTVRERFETWARERGQPVGFMPGIGSDELLARFARRGWRPKRGFGSTGHKTLRFEPPVWTRLRWWLTRRWR